MFRRLLSVLVLLASGAMAVMAATSAGSAQGRQAAATAGAEVIAAERGALDRWIKGDPGGFLDIYGNDVTYFDPSQEGRIDGLPALTAYLDAIRGKVRIGRYEMLEPKVQRRGDIAILTYRVVNYNRTPDGAERPATRWNVTEVFQRMGGTWRSIHSHFSYTKPELKPPDR